MAAKLTRLSHKIAIQLHLMIAVPFAVLAPGSQSGNVWIHSLIINVRIAHFSKTTRFMQKNI